MHIWGILSKLYQTIQVPLEMTRNLPWNVSLAINYIEMGLKHIQSLIYWYKKKAGGI